jgi:diguanylate cyclase (GGDEF)-like protein
VSNLETIQRSTILIVDDMVSNIEILEGILNSEYEILFATNGQDALEISAEQIPDLILLDIIMPEMDGFQVCQKLKISEKTRDIPVIFVTANNQEDDESRGFEEGVVDYITKPVRSSIVKARVRLHLELKRYRDHLEALSTIDGLTGIANRRKFDETIENEWRRARRNQSLLSLIMMDIDLFKAYNDHYGHLAGDECLQRLAGRINGLCRRPADLLARYGGEEFVMLLPDMDTEGGVLMANNIQKNVAQLRIPHEYSEVADYVTLSIGVATRIPGGNQTQFDLIHTSDSLLYSAKRGGRNQIKSQENTVSLDTVK